MLLKYLLFLIKSNVFVVLVGKRKNMELSCQLTKCANKMLS